MANVLLPPCISSLVEAEALQKRLLAEYDVYIICSTVPTREGHASANAVLVFVRISAQVYLELKDFELLARAVKECIR